MHCSYNHQTSITIITQSLHLSLPCTAATTIRPPLQSSPKAFISLAMHCSYNHQTSITIITQSLHLSRHTLQLQPSDLHYNHHPKPSSLSPYTAATTIRRPLQSSPKAFISLAIHCSYNHQTSITIITQSLHLSRHTLQQQPSDLHYNHHPKPSSLSAMHCSYNHQTSITIITQSLHLSRHALQLQPSDLHYNHHPKPSSLSAMHCSYNHQTSITIITQSLHLSRHTLQLQPSDLHYLQSSPKAFISLAIHCSYNHQTSITIITQSLHLSRHTLQLQPSDLHYNHHPKPSSLLPYTAATTIIPPLQSSPKAFISLAMHCSYNHQTSITIITQSLHLSRHTLQLQPSDLHYNHHPKPSSLSPCTAVTTIRPPLQSSPKAFISLAIHCSYNHQTSITIITQSLHLSRHALQLQPSELHYNHHPKPSPLLPYTAAGSFRVRSTNGLRVTPPLSMKFGTRADNA